MHVRAEATFGADPSQVAAMLADEEFVRWKIEGTGARSHTATVVKDASGAFTVTTRRLMPTDTIPAQFRSLVGATVEIREVEAWEPADGDQRHGTVLVEVTGAPVRLTGTLHLGRRHDGSAVVLEGELKAAVPLFASAIEQATANAALAVMAAEERAGREWLARQGGSD